MKSTNSKLLLNNQQYPECNPDKNKCKGFLVHIRREKINLRGHKNTIEHVYKCTQCEREIN